MPRGDTNEEICLDGVPEFLLPKISHQALENLLILRGIEKRGERMIFH